MDPHHVLTQLMPPTERMSRQLRVFRATWCCLAVCTSTSRPPLMLSASPKPQELHGAPSCDTADAPY